MKIKKDEDKIEFEKKLNELDELVIDFVNILKKLNINYVLVSGYVSILFGRSRSSEDIDIIIEKIKKPLFDKLWEQASKDFECIITKNRESAYEKYLLDKHSIRFSRKNKFIPNIEIKFPSIEVENWALKNKEKVVLNDKVLYVSPIELQIPFKLFLGSEKDIEDAKYLYDLFNEKLNLDLFRSFLKKFNKEKEFKRYLK